jgi:hypothetical protein
MRGTESVWRGAGRDVYWFPVGEPVVDACGHQACALVSRRLRADARWVSKCPSQNSDKAFGEPIREPFNVLVQADGRKPSSPIPRHTMNIADSAFLVR